METSCPDDKCVPDVVGLKPKDVVSMPLNADSSTDVLLSELEAAAKNYDGPSLSIGRPLFSGPLGGHLIHAVVLALLAVPEIAELTKQHQLCYGSGVGTALADFHIASGLVRRTRALGNANLAVDELLKLVSSNSAEEQITLVLAGPQVKSSVELGDGIMLCPIEQVLAPAWYKDLEDERRWPMDKDFQSVRPSAALVLNHMMQPIFSLEQLSPNRFPESEIDKLRLAADCMSLVSGKPVARVAIWCESVDPRLPIQTSGTTIHEGTDPGIASVFDVDGPRVIETLNRFATFEGSKTAVQTSISRLSKAWRSRFREARVIELGIALESLLLFQNGGGPREPTTEITYKLASRAAWLVGQTPERRESVFKLVRRLYSLRSAAAHAGVVKVSPDNWEAIDAEISSSIQLTCEMVLALVQRQTWPDWNRLVLGFR